MSQPNSNIQTSVHHLVQLSYATPLLARKSVLFLGQDSAAAAFIALSGANVAAVTPVAPDPPWPQFRSEEGVVHHVMSLDNLAFEDAVFGAAVIPNLAEVENPAAVLKEVRRILRRDGHLIVAAPNPETVGRDVPALDYYKLHEMLCVEFGAVQMIGQSPFNGYSVVDLSNEDGELEVSFNSELLGNEAEEISWFLAVCGTRRADVEPYAILQVPSDGSGGASAARFEEELRALKLELGNRGVRIESLEKSLEEELMQSEAARERAVKLAKELDNERKAATKKTLEDEFSKRSADIDLNGALAEAKKDARRAEERANSAESARDELIDRLRADASELERLRNKMQDMEQRPKRDPEAEKKIRRAEERANSAEAARDELIDRMRADAADLDRLRERRDKDAAQISAFKSSEAKLREEVTNLKKQLAEATAQLADSAAAVQALDAALAQAKAEAAEVVTPEMPVVPPAPAAESETAVDATDLAALERENQALEKQLAETAEKRRDAEEEAARQTVIVRDLVVRLESLGKGGAALPDFAVSLSGAPAVGAASSTALEERIQSLETELAALWGAKAGEHRARVEAELELTGKMVEIERLKDMLTAVNLQLRTRDEELRRMTDARDALRDAAQNPSGEKDEGTLRLEMHIAEMESELQSSKWKIDELAARKADVEKQLEDAVREVAALRASFSERKESDAREVEALDLLRGRLSEVEDENRRLAASLESVKRRERMLDDETESLTVRSKTLRADLDASLARVASLSDELSSARSEGEQMTEKLHLMTAQLADAEQRCAQVENDLRDVNEEASVSRVKLDSADVELKGAHDKISDLSRIVDSMKDESGRLTEVLDALDRRQSEVYELREQLIVSERQLSKDSAEAEQLRSELDALKASLVKESEMTRLAGADAARASGEALSLKARLERSTAAIEERDAEIALNLNVISMLRAEAARAAEKLRMIRANDTRVDALRRELASLKGETSTLSSVVSKKEAELSEKDSALAEKEAKLGDKLLDLSEKISKLVEKESKLSEMETELLEKESKLRNRELDIRGKEVSIHDKEAELEAKAATLEDADTKGRALAEELATRLRSSEEAAATIQEMEAKIVAVNQSKVGLSVELADAIQNGERLTKELAGLKAKEEALEAESAALKNKLAQADALSREHSQAAETAAALTVQIEELRQGLSEKESLIGSLTEQLEERERRASKLERQNRALTEQIQEHEGDLSAWDMELKLRSVRISQLEKELAEAKSR